MLGQYLVAKALYSIISAKAVFSFALTATLQEDGTAGI